MHVPIAKHDRSACERRANDVFDELCSGSVHEHEFRERTDRQIVRVKQNLARRIAGRSTAGFASYDDLVALGTQRALDCGHDGGFAAAFNAFE
jgi:hypothetical protein